jgi:hypothetical protein
MLDDRDLGAAAATVSRRPRPALAVATAVLVPLSCVPFLVFVPALRPIVYAVAPIERATQDLLLVNAYHLFASMTLVRREPVIEGTADGETWRAYELRYEPGDVDRAPPFVAPHQPRVDFLDWFLFLGGREHPYFDTLLDRLLHDPDAVSSLLARNPFPDAPPIALRVAVYRYRFTDLATRRATGAWWTRELLGYSRLLRR